MKQREINMEMMFSLLKITKQSDVYNTYVYSLFP
jgi:hypothetical protein